MHLPPSSPPPPALHPHPTLPFTVTTTLSVFNLEVKLKNFSRQGEHALRPSPPQGVHLFKESTPLE